MRQGHVITRLAAIAALSVVGVGLSATSAAADPFLDFADETQTLEYGQDWYVGIQVGLGTSGQPLACTDAYCRGNLDVRYTGTGEGSFSVPYQGQYMGFSSLDFAPDGLVPAGEYRFEAGLVSELSTLPRVPFEGPVTVTIEPADVATEVRFTADPLRADTVTVSTILTGPFIDLTRNAVYDPRVALPGGSWHLEIVDDEGEVVFTDETAQPAGGQPSHHVAWSEAEAGGRYTAAARFEVDGGVADNFAMVLAEDVSYVAPAAAPPPPGEPQEPVATPAVVDPLALTVPAAALIAFGVLAAGLLAFVIVAEVRRRRSGSTPAPVAEVVR